MAQSDPDLDNLPGALARAKISEFNRATLTSHKGNTPPPDIGAGGIFLEDLNNPWSLKMKTDDAGQGVFAELLKVDPDTGKINLTNVNDFTCTGSFTSKGIVDNALQKLIDLGQLVENSVTYNEVFFAGNARARFLSGRADGNSTNLITRIDALIRLDNYTDNGSAPGIISRHRIPGGEFFRNAGFWFEGGGIRFGTSPLGADTLEHAWTMAENKRLLPALPGQFGIGANGLEVNEIFVNTVQATTVNQSSDQRLKKPLGKHEFDLDLFMDIEIEDFSWKGDVAENGDAAQRIVGVFWQQVADAFEKHGYDVETEGLLQRTRDDQYPDDRDKDRLSLDMMCLMGRMMAGMKLLFREVGLHSK